MNDIIKNIEAAQLKEVGTRIPTLEILLKFTERSKKETVKEFRFSKEQS